MVRYTAVNYSVIREQVTGNREQGRGDRLQGTLRQAQCIAGNREEVTGKREHRKKDRIDTY
ncbi:MAG: hypothetical protein ACK579_00745 [Dolichospermum sp.]